MLIIWRYLLSQFLMVLALCVVSFIAILLTTRLDEIAHFASLGAQGMHVLKFTLHQIPYILPIAIPISCLISSIILVQRLSSTHELTAMRASGLPLRYILSPILIVAAFLSLLNFYIVSETATRSHLTTNQLKTELRAVNPLLLLHNKHMMRLKGVYFDTLGASKMGESASNIILAMPNKNNNRINIMLAENLQASPKTFVGTGVTLFTSLRSDTRDRYDHLMVENMGKAETTIDDFAQMLQKKVWTLNNDHLGMALLLLRIQDEKAILEQAQAKNAPAEEVKVIRRNINRGYTEIIRRISIGLAAFCFTFMGLAFGVNISRNKSNRGVVYVAGLAALYMIAFFAAKSFEYQFTTSSTLYLAPEALIIVLSFFTLWRTSKGIE